VASKRASFDELGHMLALVNAAAWSRFVEPAWTSGGPQVALEGEKGEESSSSKPLNVALGCARLLSGEPNGGGLAGQALA